MLSNGLTDPLALVTTSGAMDGAAEEDEAGAGAGAEEVVLGEESVADVGAVGIFVNLKSNYLISHESVSLAS